MDKFPVLRLNANFGLKITTLSMAGAQKREMLFLFEYKFIRSITAITGKD